MIECSLKDRLEASEEAEWCEFVDNQRSGNLFQKPIWHKASQVGGRVLYFSAHRDGHLVMTAMLCLHLAIARLGVLSASCYRGPVCDSLQDFMEVMPLLLSRLKDIGVASLRIQPYWSFHVRALEARLQEQGFRDCQGSTHYLTALLELSEDEDRIMAGFRKDTRRDIRRSKRMGLTCSMADSDSEAEVFLNLQSLMAAGKHLDGFDHAKFMALWEGLLRHQRDGILNLTWYDNKAISGGVILRHGNRAHYYRGASLPSCPGNVPRYHLGLWESILWAKRIGCTAYDLGGVPDKKKCDDPQLRGIRHFKLGFSKNEVRLVRQHCIELRPGLLKLQRGYRWLRYGWGRKRERDRP